MGMDSHVVGLKIDCIWKMNRWNKQMDFLHVDKDS